MTHDEMIAVIKSHQEGKRVEDRPIGLTGHPWKRCPSPTFSFGIWDYRIAREPRKCWIRWNDSTGRPEMFCAHDLPSAEGWQLVTEQL